jgi:branched-chain amino acid transport system substrate-binding protein
VAALVTHRHPDREFNCNCFQIAVALPTLRIGRQWGYGMGTRIRTVVAVATFALVTAGLSGCGGGSKPASGTAGVLRLGALVPLSGDSGPTGQRMLPAYQMAIDEANRAGGVLNHRVELVTGDDACDPSTAITAVNDIVAKNIVVSVGGACSAATVPTLKVFRAVGVPMIIPASNSTELLAPRYDSVFLLSGTTAIEARRAVEFMRTGAVHRLALIDDGTSFPQTLATAAAASAQQPGSGITVAAQLALSQAADGYPRIVEAVQAANADMVFFTGYYAEAAKLIRDLRAAGYAGKIMLSDAGTDPQLFTQLTADKAESVYGWTLPLAQFEPKAAAWAARYKKITGETAGPFTMQAYDAVKLALDAVRRAGTLDHAKVRAAIAATAPGDVTLLSGPSKFQSDGTQENPTFVLLQIHDGAFTLAPREAGQ